MGAMTKVELEAMIRRLQRSLDRANTKIAALDKSLERAEAKNNTLTKSLDRVKVKNKTLVRSLHKAKSTIADLEKLASEGREREKVTAEILSIISRSPRDTQPVFDAIVRSGVPLFRGMSMSLRIVSGDYAVHAASSTPESAGTGDAVPAPLADLKINVSRAIAHCEVQQIADALSEDPAVSPLTRKRAQQRGWRAGLFAPMMLREGKAIGAVGVFCASPGPFSDKEIALGALCGTWRPVNVRYESGGSLRQLVH